MAFSGGTFSRTFDCTTDRDNGVKILASKFDTELDGMATGLSTCILKDGTQTCTAAIPFAQGITLPDNKTIILGTNSDVTIQYDETTNDSLEIAANVEGAALGIVLKADQGDDNADQHKVNIADGGTLTMASKISGSFVSYLTHAKQHCRQQYNRCGRQSHSRWRSNAWFWRGHQRGRARNY